jgi:hypothetical protein
MPVCLKCGWELVFGPAGCGCPKPTKLPDPLPQGLVDLIEKWKKEGCPSLLEPAPTPEGSTAFAEYAGVKVEASITLSEDRKSVVVKVLVNGRKELEFKQGL